jgi:orotidine 5'-phosphate decarboxylase subfamily 2
VIELTAPYAAAFKPNSAFFEAAGTSGLELLAEVIAAVPSGKLVVLDAKRGDMGPTAEAYAHAAFKVLGADAVTVSPYLGPDSVAPFVADPTRGAIVLCHTSNPGASVLQHLLVGAHAGGEGDKPGGAPTGSAGEPLYLAVARHAPTWSAYPNVGLVVGATYPSEMAAVRAAAPSAPFLIPGVGAQGGDVDAAVAAGLDAHGGGILVSSSRGLFYAPDPARAAADLAGSLATARERALAERGRHAAAQPLS